MPVQHQSDRSESAVYAEARARGAGVTLTHATLPVKEAVYCAR